MLKSRIGRFLGIHTNYPATGSTASTYVPAGVNEGNVAYVRAVVPSTMATDDTWHITVPVGMDAGFLPADLYFVSYTPPATGNVWSAVGTSAGFEVVSHDTNLGLTILKALGTVTASDVVVMRYIGADIGGTT